MYRRLKRIKKKKPLLKNKFFWYAVFGIVLVGFFVYGVVFAQIFQIKTVRLQENDSALQKALRNAIEPLLSRNLLVFQTRSIFLFNSKEIQRAVTHQFPEIENLKIKRSFPSTLDIIVLQRKEVALWCKTQDVCFEMDKNGIIFKEKSPEGDFIVLDSTASSNTPQLGEIALQENILAPLLKFKNQAGIAFVSVSFISNLQAHFKTPEGWKVYIDPSAEIQWQITKLQTVLNQKIPSNKRTKLEYIDLRFGDQAYVKYQK